MRTMKTTQSKKRMYLLTWLLIPLLLMWVSVTYLIGLNRGVDWVQAEETKTTTVLPTSSREPFVWKGNGLVTLWFDDAWLTQFTVAYPLLQEKGFKAVIAPSTELVGYDAYMTWPQLQQLQYKGWEVASHAQHHACDVLAKDTKDYLVSELEGSKEALTAHNLHVSTYVAPCGVVTDQMVDLSKDHYIAFRGSQPGLTTLPVTDHTDIKVKTILSTTTPNEVKAWIAEAEATNSWLNIVFHQVDTSNSEYSVTPRNLQAILDVIQSSDLSVVVPDDVFQIPGGNK